MTISVEVLSRLKKFTNMKIKLFTWDSGLKIGNAMAEAFKCGKMVLNTRAIGLMTKQMASVG